MHQAFHRSCSSTTCRVTRRLDVHQPLLYRLDSVPSRSSRSSRRIATHSYASSTSPRYRLQVRSRYGRHSRTGNRTQRSRCGRTLPLYSIQLDTTPGLDDDWSALRGCEPNAVAVAMMSSAPTTSSTLQHMDTILRVSSIANTNSSPVHELLQVARRHPPAIRELALFLHKHERTRRGL
jgi:hypothetical protein